MNHYRIKSIKKEKDVAVIKLEGYGVIYHPYDSLLDLLTHDIIMTGFKNKWVNLELTELKTYKEVSKYEYFKLARELARDYKNIKFAVGYSKTYRMWSIYASDSIGYNQNVLLKIKELNKYGLDPVIHGLSKLKRKTITQMNREEHISPSKCSETYYSIEE